MLDRSRATSAKFGLASINVGQALAELNRFGTRFDPISSAGATVREETDSGCRLPQDHVADVEVAPMLSNRSLPHLGQVRAKFVDARANPSQLDPNSADSDQFRPNSVDMWGQNAARHKNEQQSTATAFEHWRWTHFCPLGSHRRHSRRVAMHALMTFEFCPNLVEMGPNCV